LKMVRNSDSETIENKKSEDEESKDLEENSDDEMQGIMVDKIYPFTDTADKLKKQDVILEIDGIKIGDDGTISHKKNSRIDLNYIITNKFEGDSVKLTILRDGKKLHVDIILKRNNRLCPVHLFNTKDVEYFIFGGLVFLALSRPYLQHKFGEDTWTKKTPSTLKYVYYHRLREFEDQQAIVLSQVLASEDNIGYHNYKHYLLDTINDDKDNKIRNIKHLAETVDNLVKNGDKKKFIKFSFESSHIIVLNVNKAVKSGHDILKRHKIEYDRSENLRVLNGTYKDKETK